ncbi:MAG: glycoside hydrolase family 99-like domain-containing protein [Pseudomonadales bacterium]|nr:glycoside hydrolase family 99-like domain-containing protein [Pseudomonadales bacterium]
MISKEHIPLGAYFYPLTNSCPIRNKRAKELGFKSSTNETLLAQEAESLFEGHDQPKTYSLGDLDKTVWDDSDRDSMAIQIELAQEHELDFFIFNSYMGNRYGVFMHEASAPLDDNFLEIVDPNGMKFATMITKGGTRAALPIPFGEASSEPNRDYDISVESARAIVDKCARTYWDHPNYLFLQQKPYLSYWLPGFSNNKIAQQHVTDFVDEIYNYSLKQYGIDPYLVGVIKRANQVRSYIELGLDHLTSYAMLADFSSQADPIQVYEDRVEAVGKEWAEIKDLGAIFVPSAVIGWDGSPRGEKGRSWNEVKGTYPHSPVIIDETPEKFSIMLANALKFVAENVPKEDRYGVVCAWNEVTEGSALLPRIFDNEPSFAYLEIIKNLSK